MELWPPLARLRLVKRVEEIHKYLSLTNETLISLMDDSIGYLMKLGNDASDDLNSTASQWVSVDPYRKNYRKAVVQKLRDVVEADRSSFFEQIDNVEILFQPSTLARSVYGAMIQAKDIQRLIIRLRWDVALEDLCKFSVAVTETSVLPLTVDDAQELPNSRLTLGKINGGCRYGPLMQLMLNWGLQLLIVRDFGELFLRVFSLPSLHLPGHVYYQSVPFLNHSHIVRDLRGPKALLSQYLRLLMAADISKGCTLGPKLANEHSGDITPDSRMPLQEGCHTRSINGRTPQQHEQILSIDALLQNPHLSITGYGYQHRVASAMCFTEGLATFDISTGISDAE
ncbi:hypothetical protein BC939DRAFT_502644 [Gamsiella multidivaricata]|uniref:uncharacterized protein n=1 Tax=Gamsiella multidivaricata TaxID=101098 RepID=UPI00221E7499|nr:uncharacterized protein BC939DRAFT_502644 [Gamsiella multidivaricata]KAI7824661.1 hypothetical protein BC939DRAFT_502644 [Gamsiella multidivaricata]